MSGHPHTNTGFDHRPKRKPNRIDVVGRSPNLDDPDDCEDDDDTSERKHDSQSKFLLFVDPEVPDETQRKCHDYDASAQLLM